MLANSKLIINVQKYLDAALSVLVSHISDTWSAVGYSQYQKRTSTMIEKLTDMQ